MTVHEVKLAKGKTAGRSGCKRLFDGPLKIKRIDKKLLSYKNIPHHLNDLKKFKSRRTFPKALDLMHSTI